MKGLDYSKFKKISSNPEHTVLKHKDGHELKIAHKGLSDRHREELHRLPMAKGGEVQKYAEAGAVEPEEFVPGKDYSKEPLPGEPTSTPVPGPESKPKHDKESMIRALKGQVPYETVPEAPEASQSPSLEVPQPPPQAPTPTTQPEPSLAQPQAQNVTSPAPPSPVTEEKTANKDFKAETKASTPAQAATDTKASMQNERDAFVQDLELGHIQPKTYKDYFHDQNTLGKIATVFGMFLGGVGGGLTGTPNGYLEAMDKLIQRDLEAQEKSNTNAQNWYQTRISHMRALNEGRQLTLEEKKQARAMAETDMLESSFHNLKLKAAGNPSNPEVQKAQVALAALYPVIQTKINNLQDLQAAAVAYSKTPAGMAANQTSAQKEVDQQYSKDYTKWVSEDRTAAEAGLKQLEEAKQALEKNHNLSGGLTGALPERLTSSEVLAQRRRILKAGLPTLKATFGAQLSDSERKTFLESIYNEKADYKTNIAGLQDFIDKARTDMARKNELASQYQKYGTISNYKPELKTPEAAPETVERLDPKTGRTVVFDAKTKQPLRFK